jgi:triosephosphate isomerase (TIM)
MASRPSGSSREVEQVGPRKYLVAGNWKSNGSLSDVRTLVKTLNEGGALPSCCEVAVCPPFVHIAEVTSTLRDDVAVGAQNCGVHAKNGAYTGEIGAGMIKDVGCTWVIIGHSERRMGFEMQGESPELCAKKTKVAIEAGLQVMFCIGESKDERESDKTMEVCAAQLEPLAKTISESDWSKIAIAYEPVWAIGTGLTATPEMAQETHAQIRQWIRENVSDSVAEATRIQYGGSMKGSNAKELLAQPDIDGGLIGGASLTSDFMNVVNGVPEQVAAES